MSSKLRSITKFTNQTSMYFVQKIYLSQKPFILTDNLEEYLADHPEGHLYTVFPQAKKRYYQQAWDMLKADEALPGIIIVGKSEEKLIKKLHKLYGTIQAGGGLVANENGDLLLIYRRGKWDLPKGKLDEGEDISECAVREVKEETGLKKLKLGDLLIHTYHLYEQAGIRYVKQTTWYKMESSVSEKLAPQVDEDIDDAKWINKNGLYPYVINTYGIIKDVLTIAGYTW